MLCNAQQTRNQTMEDYLAPIAAVKYKDVKQDKQATTSMDQALKQACLQTMLKSFAWEVVPLAWPQYSMFSTHSKLLSNTFNYYGNSLTLSLSPSLPPSPIHPHPHSHRCTSLTYTLTLNHAHIFITQDFPNEANQGKKKTAIKSVPITS